MFAGFKYESIPLKDILLDEKNPRIVSQTPLRTQAEILQYLYAHEELENFIRKIASEGRNFGAERPYAVKKGNEYIVIEGNTRIAAYKILTGLLKPPPHQDTPPHISEAAKKDLLSIDCSIAPNRDALMPIMASAHFGTGDKSKWGFLGSRKAVFDEYKSGKSLARLAKLFKVSQGDIKDFILEYQLYLKALSLNWTSAEKDTLLNPNLAFNPPVRFLQSSGHKEKVGISYDTTNLKIVLPRDAEKKFKHLIKKLVISPVKGLGATASYDAVFEDFQDSTSKPKSGGTTNSSNTKSKTNSSSTNKSSSSQSAKPGALFSYQSNTNSGLLKQLMKEAKDLRANKFPAAATFLLRNIVEATLRHIIDDQKANKTGNRLDLEGCLNLCANNSVTLPSTDKKILSEFKRSHLDYLNLGAHGNLIPNETRVLQARDTIDQFIKKHA